MLRKNFPGRKDMRRRDAIERILKPSLIISKEDSLLSLAQLEPKLYETYKNTEVKLSSNAHAIKTKKHRESGFRTKNKKATE